MRLARILSLRPFNLRLTSGNYLLGRLHSLGYPVGMSSMRSSARLASRKAGSATQPDVAVPAPASKSKRKATGTGPKAPAAKKSKATPQATEEAIPLAPIVAPTSVAGTTDVPVPAILTFNFDEAMQYLIDVDSRFEDLFDKMPCKPFEHLEQLHPFR